MQIKEIKYYDDETLELVAERFFIDGEEVESEVYDDFVDELLENEVCYDCGCECCHDCECDDEITYDELLDEFVEKIVETCGCPGCIKDVLEEFSMIFNNENK